MKTLTESPDLEPHADLEATGDVPATLSRVGERVGHFRIVSELGRGGMGVVYLAEDLTLRRRVALKVLPAAALADAERRARFLREARAASAVAHPGVAAVFEVGEDGEDLFLVMEYVAGETLHDRLERGALEIGEARRIALAIAAGMAAAHEAGVIHRDLKPANVMIAAGDEAVKILDFGIARSMARADDPPIESAPTVTAGATVEGRILGTPGYMAPEQMEGRAVDGRADVFAFGVVLYEMVTGARPFAGDTAIERLVAVSRDAPVPPSARRPGVPAALDRVILRCLEKRPGDRFASFRDVLAAFEAPPVPTPRARRLALALGGLGAALVGIVAVGIVVRRASRALPSPTAVPAPPPVAIRRPCLEAEGGKGCSDPTVVPWCDDGGHALACCGKGLVATGVDGICGCAPGGTDVREALDRGCSAYPSIAAVMHREARDRAAQKAIDCMAPGIDAGWSRGGAFSVAFFLSPEGEVFGAHLASSTIPEVSAQACVLSALRSTRFPPPRGEDVGRREEWGLAFE